MRGGARVLRLLVAGVFVGVAAVALVGVSSQTLRQGAQAGALEGVGGDVSLRLFHTPPTKAQQFLFNAQGATSLTAELRPMAHKPGHEASQLVELKGVDDAYPLYGTLKLKSGAPLGETLSLKNNQYGAIADPELFKTLGVEIGGSLQIGAMTYQLRDVLTHEPDRAFRAFSLGPRVMVLRESLSKTGLINDGAEVYFYTHIKLAQGKNAATVLSSIDTAFPNAGWRMVNAQKGVPGVERTLAMAHVLLLFIGLGIMLIGGAGISAAVRAHIRSKLSTIAILKSIGTPPNVVALAMGFEVMFAASLGAIFGVALGAFGALVVGTALADQVPFTMSAIPDFKALFAAALFGLLIALLFAWWPLANVSSVTARMLLRERFVHVPGHLGLRGGLGALAIVALILGLIFWVSPMPILSGVFLVGSLALAAFYMLLGRAVAHLAKVLSKGRTVWLRTALGNLYRAGSPTGAVVMALGLTLTVLVALDGLGRAASSHIGQTLPDLAPDLVVFSLSQTQAKDLRQDLENWGGSATINIKPFLHARVQALNGVSVQNLQIPRSLSWVIRGDRGVSYGREMDWWAKDNNLNAPGFAVDAGAAKKLGLKVGDSLTLNVSGHVIEAPILNLRVIDWTGLDLEFPIVATPSTLQDVPHTFAGALKAMPGRAVEMENRVKANFPDVPVIRVSDVIDSLSKVLNALVSGLNVAAIVCGIAALVVLAGSVLQGLQDRADEALLYKILGARQGQLLIQVLAEFMALGLVVSVVAVPIGLGLAYGVARAAGLERAQIGLGGGLPLALFAIGITVAVGLLVTSRAYRALPSAYLRRRGV